MYVYTKRKEKQLSKRKYFKRNRTKRKMQHVYVQFIQIFTGIHVSNEACFHINIYFNYL